MRGLLLSLFAAGLVAGCGCSDENLTGSPDASRDEETDAQGDTASDNSDVSPDSTIPVCGNGHLEDGEACDDGNEDDWDGCHGCEIGEFIVNSYTESRQVPSDVATFPDGSIVFAWSGSMVWDHEHGVAGRIFLPSGRALGDDFRVNTCTDAIQSDPAVATLYDGNIAIAWDSWYQDGDGCGVFGQLFDSSTHAVGVEFQVNSFTESNQGGASLATGREGRLVAVWESDGFDGDFFGISGQLFTAEGEPLGAEILVNSYAEDQQGHASVAMASDGHFVVAWSSRYQDGDEFGIFAQRFDSDGARLGSEFQVNSLVAGNQNFPDVAMDERGRFVVVWWDYAIFGTRQDISARMYASDGIPIGDQFKVNPDLGLFVDGPSVAMRADGGFAIAWTATADWEMGDIYCAVCDETGTVEIDAFRVTDLTESDGFQPSMDMLADGRFVISWASRASDSEGDVFAQRFDSDGNPIGTLPW